MPNLPHYFQSFIVGNPVNVDFPGEGGGGIQSFNQLVDI
jgi:hypothetical protein